MSFSERLAAKVAAGRGSPPASTFTDGAGAIEARRELARHSANTIMRDAAAKAAVPHVRDVIADRVQPDPLPPS